MKRILKFLTAVCAVAPTYAAVAAAPTTTNYNWVAIDSSWSGVYAEPTHWKNNSTGVTGASAPVRQSTVYVGAPNGNAGSPITADTTITFPDSDYDTYAYVNFYGASNNKVLTFEGEGTFRQRTAETDNFAGTTPFRLFSWDRVQIMTTYNSYLSADLQWRQAGFAFTNPLFRLWTEEGGRHHVSFDRGTYNFYDPEGYPLTKLGGTTNYDDVRVIFFDGIAIGKNVTVVFNDSATFKAVYVCVHSTGKGELVFNGGTHAISKCLDVQSKPNKAKDNIGALSLVVVTNGAEVTAGNVNLGASAAPQDGLSRIWIDGGSTLTITNEFMNSYPGVARLDVSGGSTLCQRGGKFYLGLQQEGSTGIVCVVDSTFDMSQATDAMYFGHYNPGPSQTQGFGFVLLTNSVWTTKGSINVGSGRIEVENGSVWTNLGSSVSIGCSAAHEGSVIVGKDSSFVSENAPVISGHSKTTADRGTGLLAFRGGSGEFASNLILANKATAGSATLELSDGGSLTVPAVSGGTGTSILTADGGTLRPTAANANFLRGLTTAELGEAGLTIDASYDITVSQDFVSAASVIGRLVKAGSETLTFAAGYAPSTVILELEAGPVAFSDAAVTLGGLCLNGGTFTFVAGKTYSVLGDVAVVDARVALPILALPSTNALFTATGTVTGKAAWENAFIVDGRETGRSYTFYTEEKDGVTTFKVAVTLPKNAEISVASGDDVTVSSVTKSDDEGQVTVSVGDRGTATVTGATGTGALVKTGDGRATFSSDANVFKGAIEVDAGLLFFANYAAYGWTADCLDPRLVLKGGTFAFSGDAETVTDLNRSLVVNAPVNTDAVVIRSDTGLKLHDPYVQSGALVKTGAGALVLETDRPCQVAAGLGKGAPGDNNGYIDNKVYQTPDFDEFGTPPTREYVGLTVFDGELVLRGTSDLAEFTLQGGLGVGFPTTNLTVQPKITVDHAKVTMNNKPLYMAQYKQDYSSYVTDAYLTITNGAYVDCGTGGFNFGYRVYGSGITSHVLIDDATLKVGSAWATLIGNSGMELNLQVCNGGKLLDTRRYVWDGHLTATVADEGFWGGTDAGAPGYIVAMSAKSSGEINVIDGGIFGIRRLYYYNSNMEGFSNLTLNFDGGVWDTRSAGIDLLFACADRLAINTTGEGLTMNVDGDGVIEVQKAITGDGGLVKTGTGTLVFKTQKIVSSATPGTALNVGEVNKSYPGDYSVPTVTNEMASVKTLCYEGRTVVRGGTIRIQDAKCVRNWAEFEVEAGATLDLGGNDVRIVVTGGGNVVNGTVLTKGGMMLLVR